jgi:hypothetical protein
LAFEGVEKGGDVGVSGVARSVAGVAEHAVGGQRTNAVLEEDRRRRIVERPV